MRLIALLCPITALAAPSAMRLTLVVAAIHALLGLAEARELAKAASA